MRSRLGDLAAHELPFDVMSWESTWAHRLDTLSTACTAALFVVYGYQAWLHYSATGWGELFNPVSHFSVMGGVIWNPLFWLALVGGFGFQSLARKAEQRHWLKHPDGPLSNDQ